MAGWGPPSSAAVAAAAAVLLVSGCSMLRAAAPTDASPSASAPAVARASSPKASAAAASTSPRADEAGCVSAASQVHRGSGPGCGRGYVYRSVDCAAPTGMGDQLAARAIVPEFTQMASQAGVSLQLQDTAGGTSLSLYADDGSCVLTVSERPRAKTLTCG